MAKKKVEHLPAKRKAAEESQTSPEHQKLVAQIEGDLPYDRTLYINEACRYLRRSIEDILTVGKILLVIQAREKGHFREIVESNIGIPHTTAYRFMNAALKADKFPAINMSQLGHVSKVYTLLEAPEEELQKLEQLGLFAGKDMDELDKMSVKELRDLVRELKTDTDKIVKKETGKLKSHNDILRKELKEFHELIPDSAGDTKWAKSRALVSALYDNFDAALSYIIFEELDLNDGSGVAALESELQRMYSRITHKMEELQKYKRGEAR
ncbi:MAG: hypothetical protein AB1805_07405 [Nitrospirota bacterium]